MLLAAVLCAQVVCGLCAVRCVLCLCVFRVSACRSVCVTLKKNIKKLKEGKNKNISNKRSEKGRSQVAMILGFLSSYLEQK